MECMGIMCFSALIRDFCIIWEPSDRITWHSIYISYSVTSNTEEMLKVILVKS